MSADLTVADIARRSGAVLLPDNEQWRYRLEIRSESSSRVYTVAQRKSDGSWKSHRHCKHLDLMGRELRSLA